jgi:transcriptional regulator with XRE-family HTH domain
MTADDLIQWRTANSLSQSELARLLGVDHATVWRWEHNRTAVPPFLHLALKSLR